MPSGGVEPRIFAKSPVVYTKAGDWCGTMTKSGSHDRKREMLEIPAILGEQIFATLAGAAIDALSQGAGMIQAQMTETGSAAMPDWAISEPSGDSIYMTFTLKLIQLLGMIGVLKGAVGTMRYVSPEPHPKKPATVAGPLLQLFFGMMGLVPETVISIGQDILVRVGWG